MAEELNASEDLQEIPSQELDQSSDMNDLSPLAGLSNIANSYKDTPAKPDALDIYKYVVGNPLSGSNPGKDDPNYAAKAFETVKQKTLTSPQNEYANLRPYTYSGDFDGANFERYYKSSAYKNLGFSPYRDNETLYNNNMTFGDEFVRAASQWPSLVKTGFISGIKSWGDMFSDPLAPDIESARDMKRAMATGASTKGGIGGFVTNTFLNSGYMVGIGLDLLGEELALMGATALTGGLSAETTAPAMLTRLFGSAKKAAKGLDVAEDIVETTKKTSKATESYRAMNSVNDARTFWNTLPGKVLTKAGSIMNPLDNTTKALRATDYASDYAKVVGTFGAFARDVMMTKAGVSEAKLEGGMTKIDVTEELIKAYREEHGVDPTGKDLERIEQIASEQAYKTALYNLPAIMWSNKFMYETMFAPIDNLVKPNLAKFADDIIFDKKTFAAAGEGFFARTKLAAKALKDPKAYGRYAFDYLKGNFAEGIQENLQEAIAIASADQAIALYKDPARADYEGYMSYMIKGLSDQFSAQGAETFASGFLMSMFGSPMMSVPSYAISKGLDATVYKDKVKAAKEARDKQRTEEIAQLNEFYKNDLFYLAPDLVNAVKQQKISDDLADALENNDVLSARNIKAESVFEHIHTALRTGKYDVFLNKLKDYKNLSPEEAKDAFKDFGIKDGNKALKYVDKIIQRAEKIRNTYENVSNEMPNPFNTKPYAQDNPLYKANLIAGYAWEEAKKKLIFSRNAFDDLSERMEKMTQSLAKLSDPIAKSDVQSIISLMSPEGAIREITTLKKELAALDPSIKEQKSVIKDKEKKLELTEAFYDSVAKIKFETDPKLKEKAKAKAKKDFEKILKYIGGKNNALVFDSTTDQAYQLIMDNMTLSDDTKGLVETINVLSNPEGFLTVQRRLANVYNQIVDEKENVLKYNNDVFTGRRESNTTLNAIYQATGLILKPEDMKALRDALINGTPIPKITSFIDKSTEEEVSGDNAKVKIALQIWADRLALIQTTKAQQEAVEKEEVKKEDKKEGEEPAAKDEIIKGDPSTYPQELLTSLETEYNKRIKEGTLDDSLSFDDYLYSPISYSLVSKFIKDYKAKKDEEADVYSKMSLEDLKKEFDALSKKPNRTNAEELALANMENAIVVKELKAALTPQQLAALEKIEKLSKTAKKKDDQSGYVVNGVDYNLRVTKLKDKILEEKYNWNVFNYAEKGGSYLITLYTKAIKDIALKSKYKETYAKNIINFIKEQVKKENLVRYDNILTKDKTAELEIALAKDPTSLDVFKAALNNVAFKESKDTGDIVDEIARNYFEGKPIKKPSNMEPAAFSNLMKSLEIVRERIKANGEFIVSKGIKVFGEYNVKGTNQKIAGELDLLVIDKDGNFKIYDIKTSKDWADFGTEADDENFQKKRGYALQVSIYKKMLEDMLGINVTSLSLIPLETKTNAKTGKILKIENAFSEKNEKIEYDNVVEEYLVKPGKPAEAPEPVKVSGIKENTTYKGLINGKVVSIRVGIINDKGDANVNITNQDGTGGSGGSAKVTEIQSWLKAYKTAKDNNTLPQETPTEEGKGLGQIETAPNPKLVQKAVKFGFSEENVKSMSKEEKELIATATSKEDVKELLAKYGKSAGTGTDLKGKVTPKKIKGSSGWKVRFNIKATTDKDYKSKAEKLSEWLDNYFGTTKRQEQKGDGYFAFKEGSSSSVWKHLAGGDKGESDFTIYIGSKKDAIKFAKQVEESEIKDLITIGTMGEDTLIGNIVKGRFDSKEFKYLVPNVNILKKSLEEEGLSKNGEFVTETKSGIKISIIDGVIIYSTDGGKTFKDYKSSILSNTKNAVEVRNQIIEDIYGDDYTGDNAELAALEGKPAETEVDAVKQFNALPIEQQFKKLYKELKGDNVLYGTYRKGEYDTYDNQSYEVVLEDGRIIRTIPTTFNKKDAEGNPVIPEGQRVALVREMIETDEGIKNAIGVHRLDENGMPRSQSFTNTREKTPEYQVKDKTINLSLEEINKELNINSLIVAQERGYEVMYRPIDSLENPVNYLVKNIDRKGKKEVTLYSPLIPGDVVISIDSIPSVIKGIVDPNSSNMTAEDKDQTLKNKQAIVKPTTSFDNKISEDDALNNLLNNLC